MKPTVNRRTFLVGALALPCLGPLAQAAGAPALPLVSSLPDEMARAALGHNPLVVMVSLQGCPFCKVAREHYLWPMRESEGLPVVQVDMRSQRVLTDFQGAKQTHDTWIRGLGIKIAPTVIFFGPGGVELAERLTGAYIADFYGAYLDDRLVTARRRIAS